MEVQISPWFQHYPEGMPQQINPQQYNSLTHFIEQCIEEYGPRPAFECMGASFTFNELDSLSKNFAAFLQNDLKLKKGDRIAIQMPNLLQYPIAMLGALRAGLIVVNVNPLYTAREMKHQFNDSGAVAVVILANFAYNLEKIIAETSIKHVVVTEIGDQLGGLKKTLVNAVVKYVKKMVPKYDLPRAISFNKALKRGEKQTFNRVELTNEDTAFLQYTGGTTGVSKGATLTHSNLVANMEQISAWMSVGLNKDGEIMITALPLYHIYALTVNCFSMMKIGAKNVLITNPRDMKGFLKELKKHRFTVITGLNTLYNGMMNHPDFDAVDFSPLKVASAGGMASAKSSSRSLERKNWCSSSRRLRIDRNFSSANI